MVADRPPLASELFGSRYDKYVGLHPTCGALVAHLRQLADTTNLEAELDRIQADEAPTSPLRRRQVTSLRYYLRDLLVEAAGFESYAPAQTNYHLLLEQPLLWQEKSRDPIALVTFNYDTMVEKAIRDLTGRQLLTVDEYVEDEQLRLFKPHGSANWGRVMVNARGGLGGDGQSVERAAVEFAGNGTLELTNDYVVCDTRSIALSGDRLLLPALTVPIQRKQDFEFPASHLERLRTSLQSGPGPTKVLTIGWRAGEENFLKFWCDNPGASQPRLLTVNGYLDRSLGAVEKLRSSGFRISEAKGLDGGFSHLIGSPLTDFLEARFGSYA